MRDFVEHDDRLVAHQDAHALEDLKLARAQERFCGVGVVPLRRDHEGVLILGVAEDAAAAAPARRAHALHQRVHGRQRLGALVWLDPEGYRRQEHEYASTLQRSYLARARAVPSIFRRTETNLDALPRCFVADRSYSLAVVVSSRRSTTRMSCAPSNAIMRRRTSSAERVANAFCREVQVVADVPPRHWQTDDVGRLVRLRLLDHRQEARHARQRVVAADQDGVPLRFAQGVRHLTKEMQL